MIKITDPSGVYYVARRTDQMNLTIYKYSEVVNNKTKEAEWKERSLNCYAQSPEAAVRLMLHKMILDHDCAQDLAVEATRDTAQRKTYDAVTAYIKTLKLEQE